MTTASALPMRMIQARHDSLRPSCDGQIRTGEPIGQFGYRKPYVCSDCSGRTLASLVPSDPADEVIADISDEARLRDLVDLDIGPVLVIAGEDGLTWAERDHFEPDVRIVAEVRIVDDLLLVTRALPFVRFTVDEPPS